MAIIFTAPVKINKQEVLALMDLRIEVSIISLNLIKKLRLLIFYIFVIIMTGIIKVNKRFIELYENIFININKIIYKIII